MRNHKEELKQKAIGINPADKKPDIKDLFWDNVDYIRYVKEIPLSTVVAGNITIVKERKANPTLVKIAEYAKILDVPPHLLFEPDVTVIQDWLRENYDFF